MESARDFSSVGRDLPPVTRQGRATVAGRRVDMVVLQVDAGVSRISGLAWLLERRDGATLARLSELHADARENRWSRADTARARLSLLRPRRAEVNALGQAYLAAMLPGAAETAHRMRRAGLSVAVASELAAESLFGVANALGVAAADIRAPHLRFDALGAYVGSDLGTDRDAREQSAAEEQASGTLARALFVGTRRSELSMPSGHESFVAFTGVVAREGVATGDESVESFDELAELLGV